MGKRLTRKEKDEINLARIRSNIEDLLQDFNNGRISREYLDRLAYAHDVNDQYRQILPSLDSRARKKRLVRQKLLRPNEGLLLAEAAYELVNRDPRYLIVRKKSAPRESCSINGGSEAFHRKYFLDQTNTELDQWGGPEAVEQYINPQ
jgi:hypothetical protein